MVLPGCHRHRIHDRPCVAQTDGRDRDGTRCRCSRDQLRARSTPEQSTLARSSCVPPPNPKSPTSDALHDKRPSTRTQKLTQHTPLLWSRRSTAPVRFGAGPVIQFAPFSDIASAHMRQDVTTGLAPGDIAAQSGRFTRESAANDCGPRRRRSCAGHQLEPVALCIIGRSKARTVSSSPGSCSPSSARSETKQRVPSGRDQATPASRRRFM